MLCQTSIEMLRLFKQKLSGIKPQKRERHTSAKSPIWLAAKEANERFHHILIIVSDLNFERKNEKEVIFREFYRKRVFCIPLPSKDTNQC